MQYGEAFLQERFALFYAPFYTDFLDIIVVLALHYLINQFLRQIHSKGLWQDGKLILVVEEMRVADTAIWNGTSTENIWQQVIQ